MAGDLLAYDIQPAQFAKISQMVHQICGISLQPGKEGLVKARLIKRLNTLKLPDFGAYLAYVQSDASGQERVTMINALTTNKTSFFREPQHFTFLQQQLGSGLRQAQHPL